MPDRITLSRAKGYRRPPGTIQVDRITIFGNPWAVGSPGIFMWPYPDRAGWQGEITFHAALDQATAVRFYRDWLHTNYMPLPRSMTRAAEDAAHADMTARRLLILSRLPELRGNSLGCRCDPGTPCHADVLLEIANA